MRLFGELTKIEDQPDGTLKVYGVASTGARDDEGEVVLPAAMKAALPDYARYPALREMHQPTAAGRTLEATVDDDGVTRIVAQVVDPVAIAKVKSRTYSGFSIGGRVLARDASDATVITKIANKAPFNATFPPPTTVAGSIVLTPGSSPTSTPVNGSMWCTSLGCFAVINGVVTTLGVSQPAASAGGSTGQVQYNCSSLLCGIPGFTWNGSTLTLPSGFALPSGVQLTSPNIQGNTALMQGTDTLIFAPICPGTGGSDWLIGTHAPSWCSHATVGESDNLTDGTLTLDSLTTGCCNLAFGSETMRVVTTGTKNSGFGFEACHSLTTGQNNVCLGQTALDNEATGSGNVAIGAGTLDSQTGASNNTAVGPGAGTAVSTGSSETVIGQNAGGTVTSGNNNIAIGVGALFGIATGHGNVWLGGQGTTLADQNDSVTLADGDGDILQQYLVANGFWRLPKPESLTSLYGGGSMAGGSIAAGTSTQLGTGGTVLCASGHLCDSLTGELTITTGTGSPSAGLLVTINFPLTRTNAPNCVISVGKTGSAGTAAIPVYASETASSLVISAEAALAASSTYTADYLCGGI